MPARIKLLAVLGAVGALAAAPAAANAATIAPNTGTDDALTGNCTLREAVRSLNLATLQDTCTNSVPAQNFGTSDTIVLDPGTTYTLTVSGDNEDAADMGDLDVLVDMAIRSSSATNRVTIQSNVGDTDRILHVPNTGVTLSLTRLALTGGKADNASSQGGNILFAGSASDELLVTDSSVSNGLAANASGGEGGGIYASGGVTIAGSSITDNVSGGANNSVGRGGGIAITGTNSSIDISDSSIDSNDAGFDGGTGTFGIGGGIDFSAVGTCSLSIANSTVDDNRAGGGTSLGSGSAGGGVRSDIGCATTVNIDGGSISDNHVGGGSADQNTGHFGGGLFLDQTPPNNAVLDGVTVSGNLAGGNGGRSEGNGGGIYTGGDLQALDSTVTNNIAGVDSTLDGAPGLEGTGGGIYAAFTGNTNDLTIDGTTLSSNVAGENTGVGGGVSMESAGDLSVIDSTINGNTAGALTGGGGGVGGGIRRVAFVAGAQTDSIQGTTIKNNHAAGIGSSAPNGGGIAVINGTGDSFTVDQSIVTGNTADTANGTAVGGGLALDGITTEAGSYTVQNTTIHANTAGATSLDGGFGGGIAIGVASSTVEPSVALTHATLTANTAALTGGGGQAGNGGNIAVDATVPADRVDLRASILAAGVATSGTNCFSTTSAFESLGENLEDTTPTQCELSAGLGDQIGADPMLGALTPANGGDPANGGPTGVRPLLAGSPAINSVNVGCPPPTTDQRGTARPQPALGLCDAGAYEVPDTDGDGDLDTADNCPTVSNANQEDSDGDAQGDACDADDDNDTVPDGSDACPIGAAAGTDTDGDGCKDAGEDSDDDNDGVLDGADGCDTQSGPASNNGCPVAATTPAVGENPECQPLRDKIRRLSRKIKRATDPDEKAKLKKKRRKARQRLRDLGCP